MEARIRLPRHTEVEVGPRRAHGVWVEMTLGLEGCAGIILARFPSLFWYLGQVVLLLSRVIVMRESV